MSVVNCKVKYIRPEYNNLKEWMNNPNNVYIGREGVVFIDKNAFLLNHLTLQIRINLTNNLVKKTHVKK